MPLNIEKSKEHDLECSSWLMKTGHDGVSFTSALHTLLTGQCMFTTLHSTETTYYCKRVMNTFRVNSPVRVGQCRTHDLVAFDLRFT